MSADAISFPARMSSKLAASRTLLASFVTLLDRSHLAASYLAAILAVFRRNTARTDKSEFARAGAPEGYSAHVSTVAGGLP